MRLWAQIAVMVGIAVAGAGGWYVLSQSDTESSAGPNASAGQAPLVEAAPATLGEIADVFEAVGSIRANEAITVTSEVSGRVEAINFQEGQQIDAGTLLVQLDDTEVAAELAAAEAARRNAAQALERARGLVVGRAVAQARLDELSAALDEADASARAARARLNNLRIVAPFSGLTGLRQVSIGAYVSPGTAITTLDDLHVVKLEFTAPERSLASLKVGDTIAAETVVYPDQKFQGTVTAIDSRIDPVTRAVRIVAELLNSDLRLRSGLFMTVDLTLSRRANVVLVPEEALVPLGEQQFVWIVVDGKAQRRPVTIGTRQNGMAEVREGLNAGDVIITRGVQKVRDGAPVRLEQAALKSVMG